MQIMSSGDNTMVFSTRVTINDGGPGGGEAEVGSVPISVSGEDLSNVVLVTAKGATATGRLVFDGGTKPTTLTSIRITAMAADNDMMQMGGSLGNVKADGSFEMKGLGGTRLLRPVGLPQGWTLKAIRNVAGADVTDTGLDFKPGDSVAGIDIVLTNKLIDVSGTVKGGDGQPAKDYTVVLFSDDPQKWIVPSSRYVTAARPNQDGRFQVKSLPAGGYYAVALEYVAQGEWGDPELLQRLVAKATRFSIDDGDTKTLDLKITQ